MALARITVTGQDGGTYDAALLDDGESVELYHVEAGHLYHWAGSGRWNGQRVEDIAADLGDEAWEQIDAEFRLQTSEAA